MRIPCAEARGAVRGGQLLAERYELIERLGSGGMGVVYSALDHAQAEEVAIKMLRQPFCVDDLEYRRFLQEATIASRLFHPNIVEVKDFQVEGEGAPYLIMERIRGFDLHRFLDARGALIWPLAVDILRQIGSALHAAHTVGVIHRDIKPSNILLTPITAEKGAQHERFVVKVADFGISKILGSSQPSYTVKGQIIGTPEYLSPEATTGEPLDSRSDQWSLGIVAYQMLTGRLPFRHRDELTTLLKIRTQALRPLRSLAGDVPRHVTDAVEIALSKRREARFTTVQDFVRALTGLAPLHGTPRATSSRPRTYDEAVPQAVSLSNPLPMYIEPDSDPGILRLPAGSRAAGNPPTYLHELPAQLVQVGPRGRQEDAQPVGAPAQEVPASGPQRDDAGALHPLASAPAGAAAVARSPRSALRSAGWIAVTLLLSIALQELKVSWPRRPQVLAASLGPPAAAAGERAPGAPGRSDSRFLIVPMQGAEAGPHPEADEPSLEGGADGDAAPARRVAPPQRSPRSTPPSSRDPSVSTHRSPASRSQSEDPEGAAGASGPIGDLQSATSQRALADPESAVPAEPPPGRAAAARAAEGHAPTDGALREPLPGVLRKRFASLERSSGEEPHLPSALRALYRGQTLEGRYLICVLADGSVHSVTVKKAAAGTDAEIVAALRSWRYPAQPAGTLTCTAELLQFEL